MIRTSSIWENRKIVTMIVGDVSAILRNSDGRLPGELGNTGLQYSSNVVGTDVSFRKRSNNNRRFSSL